MPSRARAEENGACRAPRGASRVSGSGQGIRNSRAARGPGTSQPVNALTGDKDNDNAKDQDLR